MIIAVHGTYHSVRSGSASIGENILMTVFPEVITSPAGSAI